jgi:hypothetical protein
MSLAWMGEQVRPAILCLRVSRSVWYASYGLCLCPRREREAERSGEGWLPDVCNRLTLATNPPRSARVPLHLGPVRLWRGLSPAAWMHNTRSSRSSPPTESVGILLGSCSATTRRRDRASAGHAALQAAGASACDSPCLLGCCENAGD